MRAVAGAIERMDVIDGELSIAVIDDVPPLPPVAVEKIVPIGNATGASATMALLSIQERQKAEELSAATHHVELSMNEVFHKFYITVMQFGS